MPSKIDCPYCGDTVDMLETIWNYQMAERVCEPCDKDLKEQEKSR